MPGPLTASLRLWSLAILLMLAAQSRADEPALVFGVLPHSAPAPIFKEFAALRELGRSAPIPGSAVVIATDLPTQLRAAILAALLGLKDNPEGRALLGPFGEEQGFRPATAAEYAPLSEVLRDMPIDLGEAERH